MDDPQAPRVILLLGPTGTGKTSIINQLSGSSLVVSDNPGSLEPVTTAVQEASCEIDGRPVLLIDTPGLDAEEGLRSVVGIIADLRNRGMKFSGIIYTCSVNENRVRPVNVFDAFRKLCGDAAMPVVTVVTTGWDHLRDRSVGEKREQELRSEKHGFRPALDRGAKIKQWDAKNPQTAEAIVKEILQSGITPVTLALSRATKSNHRVHSPQEEPEMQYGCLPFTSCTCRAIWCFRRGPRKVTS